MGTRFFLLVWPLATASAMSLSVVPSVPSPARLGAVVTFTAAVDGADSGALAYRFRTRYVGVRTRSHAVNLDFRTVVDYGPKSTFDWTTIEREGAYEVEASVTNRATGERALGSVIFSFTSLVTDAPAVTATAHPLVFIYSAPACPAGGRMRVRFQSTDGAAQETPAQECEGRLTMNFYLAGMRANTQYTATHILELPEDTVRGPALTLVTGQTSVAAPAATPLPGSSPTPSGILLHSIVNGPPIGTDLDGNLVWYGPGGLSLLTRANPGGTFLGIFEDGSQDTAHQIFREFDLAGVTVAETNAARVNDQLAAVGAQPITSFHHEAIRLADGKYLVLAGSERILTDVQGPGAADVLGDTILVLDRDLQLLWSWDVFDHLDPQRVAVLRETCSYPASLACSTFYGAGTANDWVHGNSLQLTPDGNILYSVRHQDWVVKIDYRNGAGTGDILWRLGPDGDFTVDGADADSWFSHQHDPHFLSDGSTLLLFDNGNTRINRNGDMGASRGQLWRIDEKARTATPILNADLKVNSAALGTAQTLGNGHYHFDAGFLVDPANPKGRITQALEVDDMGNIVWGMQINAQEYRNFRMDDLYTPPLP